MNFRYLFTWLAVTVVAVPLPAQDPLPEAAARASIEYAERLKVATGELAATRARIESARTPLAEATRAAEVRLAELEGEILRLETLAANGAEARQQLRRENDEARRSLGYLLSQAQEAVKALEESMLPGERPVWAQEVETLRQELERVSAPTAGPVAMAVADLAADRLARQLGGYVAEGSAVVEGDNRIVPGTFLFLGPASLFQGVQPGVLGCVTQPPGREWPTVHPVEGWSSDDAGAVFRSGRGLVVLDASGGKALALRQSEGAFLDEVRKGGVVGLVILAVGVLALIITVQKLFDFHRLAVDEPPAVRAVLALIAAGAHEEAVVAVRSLQATTRELFGIGLRHRLKPKAVLEEHLESFVMQQRMVQERRLPLLAVIATSGPLLGLLGTVTGMIKTFTLISVFGTGSAGKLSTGISEALIATKFGLMVAIPALVVHGFLSQRIQKHLALLDRYSLEIATASKEARQDVPVEEADPV